MVKAAGPRTWNPGPETVRRARSGRGDRRRRGRLARRGEHLPRAAECLVDRDDRHAHVGLALREELLRLEESALRVEHLEEVRGAVLVAQARELRGLAARALGLGERALAFERLAVADERVLGLFEREQDGVLVLRERGVGACVGLANARVDAAEVERGPLAAGAARV